MARETRRESFSFAFHDEGSGLSNYRGVLKKYGIELSALQLAHPEATSLDITQLDARRATRLYASYYWKHPGCDHLSRGLDYFVFDTGLVCGGPGVVSTWISLLAGPAGRRGYEEAIAYANGIGVEAAISGLEFYRRRRFKSSPLWPVLGAEWTNRTNRAKQRAMRLAAGETQPALEGRRKLEHATNA